MMSTEQAGQDDHGVLLYVGIELLGHKKSAIEMTSRLHRRKGSANRAGAVVARI